MVEPVRRSSTFRSRFACKWFAFRRTSKQNADDRPKSRNLLEVHQTPSGFGRAIAIDIPWEKFTVDEKAPRIIGDLADDFDSHAIRKLMETAERRRDVERRRSMTQIGFRLAHLTGRQSARHSMIEAESEPLLSSESPDSTPELASGTSPSTSPSTPVSRSGTPKLSGRRSSRSRMSQIVAEPSCPEIGIRVGEFDPRLRKPYVYNPLQSNRVIRLLSIRRPSVDHFTGDFYYQLVTMSLDDPLPYETVSYVWGNPTRNHRLNFMDGSFLMITESLGSALSAISSHCSTGYLWIDQLCIDQGNLAERGRQVRAMGDIYRRGSRVLVSLRLPHPTLANLFTLIDVALKHESNKKSVVDLQFALTNYMLSGGGSTPRLLPPFWNCMIDLLGHPWFTRAWIFQEMVLSKSVMFVFSERLVPLDPLVRLALATSRLESATIEGPIPPGSVTTQPGFHQLYSMVQARTDRALGKPQDFWQTLSSIAPYSHCSDERDSLYAFLGLLEDEEVEIQPDYRSPRYEVLSEAAKRFIEGKHSLDILSLVPRVGEDVSQQEGIPSWVPDWNQPEEVIGLTSLGKNSAFNASKARQYSIATRRGSFRPFRLLMKQLSVKGKIIAKITDARLEAFASSENWISRDLFNFLRLDLILTYLSDLSHSFPEPPKFTLDRVLKVVLADGALLPDTPEFSKGVYLSDSELKELAQAYLQFSSLKIIDSAKFQLATYARNVHTLRNLSRVAVGRRLISSEDGRLGLAHHSVQSGDLITILHGSRTPIVLRHRSDGKYEVKGQCYFEESMHGQAVFWEEDEANEFVLV